MLKETQKIPNDILLQCGLDLMKRSGRALRRLPSPGRAMLYAMETGHTVRVRTCNDHLLVVLADRDAEDARLSIEGTDYLLIVMPTVPRTHGTVVAYLVPTDVVEEAARSTHREWRATNPNTKGDNRTWNLWFNDGGPRVAGGFAKKWENYRLEGTISSNSNEPAEPSRRTTSHTLGDVIAQAKRQIAEAAGVSEDLVKISINLA